MWKFFCITLFIFSENASLVKLLALNRGKECDRRSDYKNFVKNFDVKNFDVICKEF